MTAEVDKGTVRALYESGVAAVEDTAARLGADDWDRPACGDWTATQTARHLASVVAWYDSWLDRAEQGVSRRPFGADEIDLHASRSLEAQGDIPGPDAVGAFADSARSYLERAAGMWDIPYGYPFGTVTAGLHLGVAATEWHLHAWDLSGLTDRRHTPERPDDLFKAAGMCVAAAEGGVRGKVIATLVPLGARTSPWQSLLKRSGRL